ncbi:flagellar type III secretion system pore protein FliP [Glacieibacterium sp.]|uniref:flagellar type III secretion system pore protein FliP n=1 Tax=Glacieibacterium sp. TaxID=2860237 RepID=UPI003B00F1AC
MTAAPMALPIQILLLMTALTLLPSLLLMMTGFTRILIVLAILRQAIGLGQAPPNQLLVGLALFLTLFVMRPQFDAITTTAYRPFAAQQIPAEVAIERTGTVLHGFMLAQTREQDVRLFANLAHAGPFGRGADVPMTILVPAFATSELKTAFEIGFLVYLPFLVIDLVVASILMALGMMMVSPTLISLPFKLLLFVLVDGWALALGSLAGSFVAAAP